MLNEGTEALPYEPYYEGLRDTKVTELVSEGANLIPFPYHKEVGYEYTKSGVTFTVLADGGISVVGKPTDTVLYEVVNSNLGNICEPNVQYVVGGNVPNCAVVAHITPISGPAQATIWIEASANASNNSKIMPSGYKLYRICLYLGTGAVGTDVSAIVYPTLNRGSTAKPYSKGGVVDTFPISAELRAFLDDKGYGRGVEGYPNYIDFERKVFVQNTYRKVFDGTEAIQMLNISTVVENGKNKKMAFNGLAPQSITTKADVVGAYAICNKYALQSANNVWNGLNGFYTDNKWLHIYDANYQTVEAWKAHLAELDANGNPLTIEYALAEPIEIDISAYLTDDNFIEVEGGGIIRAVNDYEYDAPSEINYMLKEGNE
jgi:hypothetical protein